jgi:hypothetical protein
MATYAPPPGDTLHFSWTAHRITAFPATPPPALPVMLSTALALELELGTHTIDLAKVTAIILRDPFATLELFRRAGEECGETLDRVEDCLISLPVSSWPGASWLPKPPEGDRLTAARLCSFAEHARHIAERCRALVQTGEVRLAPSSRPALRAAAKPGPAPEINAQPAAERITAIHLEHAYLAGLLHEAAELAAFLDSAPHGIAALRAKTGEVPPGWHVPSFVRELVDACETDSWGHLVFAAHQSALEEILVPA